MKYALRLFTFLIFFCLMNIVVKAQQKHFIYVESEDKQPFAIVLNGKVYSSSDYGYIIISKLQDGDYNFIVSFPMNKFPDQSFACTINKKDAGYILKSDNNKWVLQNFQTKKVVENGNVTATKDTAFSSMLSDVVNDSTLTKQNVALLQSTTNNSTTNNSTANNTGVAAVATVGAATAAAATVVSVLQPGTDSVNQPQKISQTNVDTGTNMQFVDKTQNGSDTVNVFIPSEQTTTTTTSSKNNIAETPAANPGNAAMIAAPVIVPSINNVPTNDTLTSANAVIHDTTASAPVNTTTDTAKQDVSNPYYKPDQNNNATNIALPAATAAATTAVVSSPDGVKQDCASTLSDDDMNKLKRKMFSQHNDNDMIQAAVKYVQKKCITTDQVKLLGSLFVSDDGRYSLYDALYKYVYDYSKYPELSSQIIDPYYKKRFASLLR